MFIISEVIYLLAQGTPFRKYCIKANIANVKRQHIVYTVIYCQAKTFFLKYYLDYLLLFIRLFMKEYLLRIELTAYFLCMSFFPLEINV